jgi:hypothetical protein
MLNMITTAEADAAEAAQRPLAGFGAGAFTCEGPWAASRVTRKAASAALPRVRHAEVAGTPGYVQAGSASRAYPTSLVQISSILSFAVKSGSGLGSGTQHFNQMTRLPLIPGGLGSHPAREPDPV